MTKYEKLNLQLLMLICETNIEILICLLGQGNKLEEYKNTIRDQREYLLEIAKRVEREL